MSELATLLRNSTEVAFSDLADVLANRRDAEASPAASRHRASTATVVVVGPPDRLGEAVDALEQLGEVSGVRAILIAEGTAAKPVVRVTDTFVAIDGLAPKYLNNAVAAVRLPCLPSLIWWRGGSPKALEAVTSLADRLVLDTEHPDRVWHGADRFFEETALTDLRWTRLTKWRAVIAHLFDLPRVRAAAGGFRRIAIDASDPPAAQLFVAWLASNLQWKGIDVRVHAVSDDGRSVLDAVQLVGDRVSIAVRRLPGRDCLEASIDGEVADVRVSPVGHSTLSACIGEELAVRSRDLAFERALAFLQTRRPSASKPRTAGARKARRSSPSRRAKSARRTTSARSRRSAK